MDVLLGTQVAIKALCDGTVWLWNGGVAIVNGAGAGIHTALSFFNLLPKG